MGGNKLRNFDDLTVELNNTKYILRKNGTFEIFGSLPTQDDVYELAMNYGLPINERLFDMTYELLKIENLGDVKEIVENFFKAKLGKDVIVTYSENPSQLTIQNDLLVMPILSKNSGNLGTIILQGKFTLDEVLGLLAFYDSLVSIIEGMIINYRLEQLLKSALDTLFVALNKRVRLSEKDLAKMENIALKIAKLEGLSQDEVRLALKIANVGFVGLKDELFEKILSGNFTEQEYVEYLKHVDLGYEILREMDVPMFVLEACLYHHEYIDGTGIKGLRGEEIPKFALAVGFAEHIVILKWGRSKLQGKYPENYIALIFSGSDAP